MDQIISIVSVIEGIQETECLVQVCCIVILQIKCPIDSDLNLKLSSFFKLILQHIIYCFLWVFFGKKKKDLYCLPWISLNSLVLIIRWQLVVHHFQIVCDLGREGEYPSVSSGVDEHLSHRSSLGPHVILPASTSNWFLLTPAKDSSILHNQATPESPFTHDRTQNDVDKEGHSSNSSDHETSISQAHGRNGRATHDYGEARWHRCHLSCCQPGAACSTQRQTEQVAPRENRQLGLDEDVHHIYGGDGEVLRANAGAPCREARWGPATATAKMAAAAAAPPRNDPLLATPLRQQDCRNQMAC